MSYALATVLWLWSAGPASPAIAGHPRVTAEGASAQILVMLRLGPTHYRPGSEYGSGYGDDLQHGVLERQARRIARAHGLVLISDWPMPLVGLDCFVMSVRGAQSVEAAAAAVATDPEVSWSEPLHIYRAQGNVASPNDPLFNTQPAASAWQLAALHHAVTGRGVRVAVIDSRIEAAHPDLVGQVAVLEDFVIGHPSGAELHGTGVAGVIAAKADNGIGIVGVAPGARLLGLRACWQMAATATATVCDSLSLAKALNFAIERRVQVINLSLSGPPDRLLDRLLEIGLARGIVVVAAFDRSLPDGGFPAARHGVIAVADAGPLPLPNRVYTAPGRDIPTTQPGGRWYLVDGSSYAAAHVSGLIALLRERQGSAGSIALVASGVEGGAIDACATILRSAKGRDCATVVAEQDLAHPAN